MAENEQGNQGFIGTIWDTIKPFFNMQWSDIFLKYAEFLPKLADGWQEKIWEYIGELDDPLWDTIIELGKESELFGPEQVNYYDYFRTLPLPVSFILGLLTLSIMFIQQVRSTSHAGAARVEQNVHAETRTTLAGASTLIKAAFIAPEKTDFARETLAKYGYSEDMIDMMFLANYHLTDLGTLRALFFRDKIDTPLLFERLHELGFTDTRINEMVQAWEVIPSTSELLAIGGRQVFDETIAQKYGLDGGLDREVIEGAKKVGVSEYWVRKNWRAHWSFPGASWAQNMYHRDIIDYNELTDMYNLQRIPQYWHAKLTKASYQIYSRFDIPNMAELGILSPEEIYYAWLDNGYDEAHAIRLTEYCLAGSNLAEKQISQSKIISAYSDRILSRQEASNMLESLGYSADKISFLLDMEDYDNLQRLQAQKISVIEDKYLAGMIDTFTAQGELGRLNLTSERMGLLLEEWQIKLSKKTKKPTKSELKGFLRSGIIDETIWLVEMGKLGYVRPYIDWYLLDIQKDMEEKKEDGSKESTTTSS